jgi:hypothetical protein
VDLVTPQGIVANSFPDTYPADLDIHFCQRVASLWHAKGLDGLVCRSASLWRLGMRKWQGDHRAWGEIVIFVKNSRRKPKRKGWRKDQGWLILKT